VPNARFEVFVRINDEDAPQSTETMKEENNSATKMDATAL
jgi:hypothetical protein